MRITMPMNQPAGSAHQIPFTPIFPDNQNASGIRTRYSDNSVVSMGMKVAPAPRKKPVSENMTESNR